MRLVTGRWLSDPTSGFRAFSPRMIAFFARHYPQSYLESSEAAVWASRQGMKLAEVPIVMRPAEHSSVGNVMGVFHSLRCCVALLIDRLEKKFPEPPEHIPPTKEHDDAR
jgi:hypothetical protein